MKALILAAGSGTRLKKYTKDLPKGMLKFAEKTIIERQIKQYKAAGVKEIIIVKGFAAEKINYSDVKYYTNEKFAVTNMVESLLTAESEFNDDIVVSYADVIFEDKILNQMLKNTDDFAVAVDDQWKEYWLKRYGRDDFDTESLSVNEDDCIIELGREAPELSEIDARYIGVLKFSQRGLKKICKIMSEAYAKLTPDTPWQQSGKPLAQAYMTDLLNALIEDGEKVRAVHFNNGWLEFDTNEDYESACEWLKTGEIKQFIRL